MKTLLAIAMSAIICQTALAQDLSSFYQISGFRLPALRTGQYFLSLSPHYVSQPYDYATLSTLSSSSSTDNYRDAVDHTWSMFGFSTNFTYGISDETTIAINLQYNPYQASGKSKYSYNDASFYTSPSASSHLYASNWMEDFREESMASSLILCHRIQRNIEFSVEAQWQSSRQPSTSIQSETEINNGSATAYSGGRLGSNNQHCFYVDATIVFLHY